MIQIKLLLGSQREIQKKTCTNAREVLQRETPVLNLSALPECGPRHDS